MCLLVSQGDTFQLMLARVAPVLSPLWMDEMSKGDAETHDTRANYFGSSHLQVM